MTTTTRLGLGGAAAALLLVALAGCQSNQFSQATSGPTNLVCDGGQEFTVTYQNGFEVAVIEYQGRTVELPKVRTALGMTPTPGIGGGAVESGLGSGFGLSQFGNSDPAAEARNAGTTGVRYSDGETIFLSRGRTAVLELDGENFSNCEVPTPGSQPQPE